VPWAMWRAGYHWSAGPRFFAKRLTRLEPPYFAAIALVLVLEMARSMVGADLSSYEIEWSRLAVHVAYLNAFVGMDWYNPVFWTLAIEFQYYVLIALVFPLLCVRDWRARMLTMLAVICVYYPFRQPTSVWLMGFLPLFMSGVLLFQRRAGIIGAGEFWSSALVLIGTTFTHSPVMPGLALLTVCLLLQDRFDTRLTAFLGQISYSLYLVHDPIAKLQSFAVPHLDTAGQRVLLALIVTGLCIPVSWMFYRLIERPSIALSKRIQYRRRPEDAQPRTCPDEQPVGLLDTAD
jgi:peptidoglycan/LPS O-acetylase OafA/YrhL